MYSAQRGLSYGPVVDFHLVRRTLSLRRQQWQRLRAAAGRARAPSLESVDEASLYNYAHALRKAGSYVNDPPAVSQPSSAGKGSQQQTSHQTVQEVDAAAESQQENSSGILRSQQTQQTAASSGLIRGLSALLPNWSPRVRGLVLLNLLVLLVATNWVRASAICMQADRAPDVCLPLAC